MLYNSIYRKHNNEKKALHAINVSLPEKLLYLDRFIAESPLLNFKHPEGVLENVDIYKQAGGKRSGDNSEEPKPKKQKTSTTTDSSSSNIIAVTSSTANTPDGEAIDNQSSVSNDGIIVDPLKHGIPSNNNLKELLKILKKEVRDGIQIVSTIKIWITMLIPKMEDGNNFGVAVQEEVNNALDEVESHTYNVLEGCQKYHQIRAKYVEKTIKHPHIDDFRRAIIERDQMEWMSRRSAIIDLRNNYATLFDMITKNLDKVTKPKGENDGGNRITYM
jgi:proteasome activator subunit 2 (PA28 beta)